MSIEFLLNSLVISDKPTSSMASHKRKRGPFECVICLESYKSKVPHTTGQCSHQLCRECIRQYFQSAVKEKRLNYETLPCPSPNCQKWFITGNVLNSFFSQQEIISWWKKAVAVAYITNKVCCPMPGCRAIFDACPTDSKQCTFTECYECHRGFCIACQNRWHPGVIKIVDDTDELLETLKKAEQSKWTRCPKCSNVVEKVSGCTNMLCTCGTFFCYRCGGISDDHYCRNKCQEFSPERLEQVRNPMFKSGHSAKRIAK